MQNEVTTADHKMGMDRHSRAGGNPVLNALDSRLRGNDAPLVRSADGALAMRFPLLGRWEDTDTGEVLVERLLVAKTFWHRFVGLQFASPLAADCGFLLRGCRSIHTFWMRFAIDVIFLNDELEVLEVRTGVAPWRMVIPQAKNVAHVIELTAGVARNSLVGRRTRAVPVPEAAGSRLGEAR